MLYHALQPHPSTFCSVVACSELASAEMAPSDTAHPSTVCDNIRVHFTAWLIVQKHSINGIPACRDVIAK